MTTTQARKEWERLAAAFWEAVDSVNFDYAINAQPDVAEHLARRVKGVDGTNLRKAINRVKRVNAKTDLTYFCVSCCSTIPATGDKDEFLYHEPSCPRKKDIIGSQRP